MSSMDRLHSAVSTQGTDRRDASRSDGQSLCLGRIYPLPAFRVRYAITPARPNAFARPHSSVYEAGVYRGHRYTWRRNDPGMPHDEPAPTSLNETTCVSVLRTFTELLPTGIYVRHGRSTDIGAEGWQLGGAQFKTVAGANGDA